MSRKTAAGTEDLLCKTHTFSKEAVMGAGYMNTSPVRWLTDSAEMKRYDRNTTEHFGIPESVLMERAALACVQVICERQRQIEEQTKAFGYCPGRRVLIASGCGNNGADGLAAGRILQQEGFEVDFFLAGGQEKLSPAAKAQLSSVLAYGGRVSDKIPEGEYDIIIDALFGVGLSRPLSGRFAEAVEWINRQDSFVCSVDLPSGIDADDGKVMGCAVQADVTVTFGFYKRGHFLYPGRRFAGRTICVPVGITEDSFLGEHPGAFTFTGSLKKLMPVRSVTGNKGTFGKAMFLAGSRTMTGAAVLCSKAAFASGCGMVRTVCPPEAAAVLQTSVPEAMISRQPDSGAEWADVIGAGPGLSVSETAQTELEYILFKTSQPLVLDADAINILADRKDILNRLLARQQDSAQRRSLILTPHPGELGRLSGCSAGEVADDPVKYAVYWAKKLHGAVLCKGASSVAASPDGFLYINSSGNSGMACAGSGDVLTGIVTALLAVCEDAFQALCIGVYLHGLAGDRAAHKKGEYSMTAADILDAIPGLLNFLED